MDNILFGNSFRLFPEKFTEYRYRALPRLPGKIEISVIIQVTIADVVKLNRFVLGKLKSLEE